MVGVLPNLQIGSYFKKSLLQEERIRFDEVDGRSGLESGKHSTHCNSVKKLVKALYDSGLPRLQEVKSFCHDTIRGPNFLALGFTCCFSNLQIMIFWLTCFRVCDVFNHLILQ